MILDKHFLWAISFHPCLEAYRNFRIATRFVMQDAQTIFQEKKSNNALWDEHARGPIARRTGDELMVYRNLTLTSGWIVHVKNRRLMARFVIYKEYFDY